MTLFRPNTTCKFYSRSAGYDVYGKTTFAAGRVTPCAVVSYDLSRMKSSVRVDSSGSRGRADELAGVARFLFPKTITVNRGDIVQKDNYWLRVIEIHPRYGVDGRLDHLEIDLEKAEPINAA